MKKFLLLATLIVFVFAAGCKKQDIKHDNADTEAAEEVSLTDEPSIRGDSAVDINLKTIYFEFDRSSLTEDSIEVLKENVAYLMNNPKVKVVLEGHTDERGTAEYNLSLGQRRALRVKEYYTRLGIAADRIATISYGKEKPAVGGSDVSAWAKNRRVETNILLDKKNNGTTNAD